MYEKLVLLDIEKYKDFRVSDKKDYSFVEEVMSVPVTMSEYFESCKSYPILFKKDKKDNWYSVVLLGLREKQNLFLNKDKKWKGQHYIPSFILNYPFALAKKDDEGNFSIAIESSQLIKNGSGEKLFNEDGSETKYLKNIVKFLQNSKIDTIRTQKFIEKLDELNLLDEETITIKNKTNDEVIKGFYRINEDRLKKLEESEEKVKYDIKMGHFITAHLISLTNIQRLGKML